MPIPDPLPESERAAVGPAVVGSQDTIAAALTPDSPRGETPPGACPICGGGLKGRQTSACSDKCRAAKSRRRRIPVNAEVLRDLRALLDTTLESLWEARTTLEKYGGG